MQNHSLQELLSLPQNPATKLEITCAGRMVSGPGWVIPKRQIADHLMYYVVAGTVLCLIDGKQIEIPSDTFFWLQPGETHTLMLDESSSGSEHIYCRFFMGQEESARMQEPFLLIPQETILRNLLLDLTPEQRLPGPVGKIAQRYAFGTLFCHIHALAESLKHSVEGLSRQQKKIALDYVRNNISRRFTITEWANELSLNADYFSRQFKKSFGEAPFVWVKRARVEKAELLLLESDLSVTAISESLGYESLYFFSRQFKEVTGRSPRAHRFRYSHFYSKDL